MTTALSTTQVSVNGATRQFYYRTASAGDRGVVDQVFRNGDYNLHGLRQCASFHRYYRAMLANGGKPFIVDAGANIGASPVWFALSYPGSHVVAIEPERNNCQLLRRNCEALDYSLAEGGISCVDGKMFLDDPGQGDWGFRLSAERGSYEVSTFAAGALVGRWQRDGYTPLLFKSDIEGGEAELFSQDVDWVDSFALLIVELHDWMLPGSANSRNFLRTIAALDMDFIHRGENVFCFNNRLLAAWANETVGRVEELRLQAVASPSPEAFLALSLAAYEAKDFVACAAASREALKLQPGYGEAYNNLGLALAELGRWEEAQGAFEQALSLLPSFELARNNLAWVRSRAARRGELLSSDPGGAGLR